MRDLPAGTVTFLFTDVEGSTRLLHELGAESYAAVLAEHRRVLREAFARHGGVEVDTEGDALFVAFADAAAAVAAAAEAQSALAGGPVAVRMGLHTGTPLLTEEGYVGVDVHKAARICAAGHGGQVLVSEATRSLLSDEGLRPLGSHRLKDLTEAEPLYQLGEGEFPPLKTLNQSNLPVQPTSFLGRERELGEVLALLRRPDVRLLTLTGSGGSGKTRLAVQAAAELVEEFPHGVWWVGLQALRDPELVLLSIATVLGAKGELVDHIADRRLLLVLDNLEQLLDAAPALGALLASCRNLRLLATSRERLRLRAEHEYAVPPFVPEEGVGFFLARARAVRSNVESGEAVAEICRRLDHLPLALELAAARLKALSPEQLLGRLGERLPLLTGGPRDAPERQRTLRAAIEWSYELLPPAERGLFAGLSVFAGGFTAEAAEAVARADLDTLHSLVDKSLVSFDGDRYAMLETIREYAAERLGACGEADDVRRRHAEFFLRLAEWAGLCEDAEGEERHDVATSEQDNLRAAIDWALDHDRELGLRLAVALEQFWVSRNPFEGIRRFEALLGDAADQPGELRARALRAYGGSLFIAGRFEEGTRRFEEGLAEYRRLRDERGIAIMLHRLSVPAYARGELERARSLAQESRKLFDLVGWRKGEAQALSTLGQIEFEAGEHDRGLALLEAGAVLARRIGFGWWHGGSCLGLAERTWLLGRVDAAERWAREALEVARRIGDRQFTVYSLAVLACVAAKRGDLARAGLLWGAIEREEQRGPVGQWEQQGEREGYAAAVLSRTGPELERGLERGRRLSLEAAIEEALAAARAV